MIISILHEIITCKHDITLFSGNKEQPCDIPSWRGLGVDLIQIPAGG
jgi:hypothetical protein